MSIILQNGSSFSNYDISDAPGMLPSKYIFNITSITTTDITGTFTGNYLYDSFGSSASTLDITEGEFNVKRVR